MVRTDTKARADELDAVYKANTTLKLSRVDSGFSARRIATAIADLKSGNLDGIICVDMLGEGFDFPNLKIAAVHSPHKSLAATLQFVGRFARTNAPNICPAKFLAVLQEVRGGIQELYEEGAEWRQIVPSLNDDRVHAEIHTKAVLSEFNRDPRFEVDEETKDLSLYSIRPYAHVKIYRVPSGAVDVARDIDFPEHLAIRHRELSQDRSAVIVLTKEETQPKWAPAGRFVKVEYDIFIVFFDEATSLLFICTSRRTEGVYRHLAEQYAGDEAEILSLTTINGILQDVTDAEFFNIGMRSRVQGPASEAYRIISGPAADRALKPSDGRMFHRGHAFMRGKEDGATITLGLSSASKIWSNAYMQIPKLLDWFRHLGKKLSTLKGARTGTGWDLLPMAQLIAKLPARAAIGIDWGDEAYQEPPVITIANEPGPHAEFDLLSCSIEIDQPQVDAEAIAFSVKHNGRAWPLLFRLGPTPTIDPVGWTAETGPTVRAEAEELFLPS